MSIFEVEAEAKRVKQIEIDESAGKESYHVVDGLLFDELEDTATGEKQVIHDWVPNRICIGFSKLVACLLKQQPGYVGCQYWAVGQGEHNTGEPETSTWDEMTPDERAEKSLYSLVKLYDEIARKPVEMAFIDGGGNETPTPTNILQVKATFGYDVSGYLREFGIFGGNATTAKDSGFMLDHRAHAVIALNIGGTSMILRRILRFTL